MRDHVHTDSMLNASLSTLAVCVLAAVGCGGDEEESGSARTGGDSPAAPARTATSAATGRPGTLITVRGSRFGRMLFDRRPQAIYLFTRDARGRSRCYGACAKAWPPVYTRGRPRASRGVRAELLGTTRRRDGRRQVTYGGHPLYFYAHESRNQVLCQNVDEFGGLWLVVSPGGRAIR
jgi:predicted lipoprotein with Yx(FWY)xxD motif